MAEIKNTWGKRALAGFGALALASAGLLGGSAAASAATEFGNIDFTKTGNINIHKHKHQNGTDAVQNPDGSGTAIPSDPIEGVTFTARKITSIDLSDSAAWNGLKGLTPEADCALPGQTFGPEIAGVTNDKGLAVMSDLSVGAYLVCETAAPAEVVDRALPTIVTIPLPFENGWLYDVHMYPKNGTSAIEKSIEEQKDLTLGSVVKFPVNTDIPTFGKDSELANYIITDTLDSRLGTVGASSITVDGVEVLEAYREIKVSGQKVTVEFSKAGLAWLKTQGGKKIVTTFQGTVESIGNGAITNEATVFVNDPSNKNGLTSKPVTTNWGDVKILKTDESKPAKGLKGAEFEVYAAADPYATTCEATPEGKALNIGGEKVFASGADGTINIAGLFVSDSVNEPLNAATRCYVVKEIKAPAGFVTPAGDKALTAVSVTKGLTNGFDVTITNTQQEVPELPLTGANGQMVMVIGGSALLLIAGGVVMLNRRRSANEQQD